jgi:hypothetical protein
MAGRVGAKKEGAPPSLFGTVYGARVRGNDTDKVSAPRRSGTRRGGGARLQVRAPRVPVI